MIEGKAAEVQVRPECCRYRQDIADRPVGRDFERAVRDIGLPGVDELHLRPPISPSGVLRRHLRGSASARSRRKRVGDRASGRSNTGRLRRSRCARQPPTDSRERTRRRPPRVIRDRHAREPQERGDTIEEYGRPVSCEAGAKWTRLTNKESILALRPIGPESQAKSLRFHGRRVIRWTRKSKHGLLRVGGRARNPKTAEEGQKFCLGDAPIKLPSMTNWQGKHITAEGPRRKLAGSPRPQLATWPPTFIARALSMTTATEAVRLTPTKNKPTSNAQRDQCGMARGDQRVSASGYIRNGACRKCQKVNGSGTPLSSHWPGRQ